MPLLKILTDPQNFRFYTGGQGSVSNSTTFGQKSIRYGNDRFNSANSGQPYITVGIPDNLTPGTTDFLQRGGINVVRDTAADVQRIAKMFADTKSPNGLLFIAKQQLLSRTAVRTQTSGLLNEGVYSPLNTLAQAGVVAFGGHLKKQGINPFAGTGAYSPNPSLYFNAVKPNPNTPEVSTASNRLVQLFELTNSKTPGRKKDGVTLNNGINVMTYTGGPDSILGIGNTGIRYADQRTGRNNALFVSNPSYFYGSGSRPINRTPLLNPPLGISTKWFDTTEQIDSVSFPELTVDAGYTYEPFNNTSVYKPGVGFPENSDLIYVNNTYTYTQQDIIDTEINEQGGAGSPTIQDFRKILRDKLESTAKTNAINSGATPEAPPYESKNIEQRVNLGDPGKRKFVGGKQKIYADYSKGINYGSLSIPNLGPFSPGLDKITSVPIYRSEEVSSDENLNDLVSFRIAVIDNDNPAFKTFLHFRAFLGPMSDTYTAEWNAFKYLGRGENFYTYGGFTRQISLSWTVAAQSKQELIPMYKKLNYLASSLTPDYSEQRFMRGNLAELTVGGYIVDQPGIITSLTYDIQEDSPWEIGINTDGNNDVNSPQMPHILRVSGFNFIPIQRFIPRKQDLAFNNKNLNDPLDENSTGFATSYGVERYISMNGDDSYGSTPFAANATQGAIPGTLSGPSPTAGLQPINLPNLNSSYKWG